jgi:hypothetical protein
VTTKKQQTTSYSDWHNTSTTEHLTTDRKMEANIVKDAEKADNLNIIVISGIGGLVILLLIVIIVVQIRGRRKKRTIKRESGVLYTTDHVDTYCEIDDIMAPSTSKDNRQSHVGKYESINESVKEKTKYTTLPTRHTTDRNSYVTPVSIAKETTEKVETADSPPVKTEPDNMESQVLMRQASTNRNLNLPTMPDGSMVSKSIASYIDMNEGEKRDEGEKQDEYVAMEGQSKVSINAGLHK